jgi:hypothetical protein
MLVARNRGIMGGRPIGGALAAAGWAVTAIAAVAAIAFVVSAIRPLLSTG